jgi:mannose-P-dolichol utilization defect protein 1
MVFLQLLSLSVNVLCLIQKLPQIIRIYQSKNVDSISVSSVLLEETAYTLILTYNLWRNYPLSTFFEYIFLFLQNLLLLWALATYSTQGKDKQTDRSRPLYGILIFCLYVLASITGLLPSAWMSICTMCVIPIGASSKIIQLRTILSNKSAGQVSRTGWAIASYGNIARIITNLIQTKDMSMVINLLISFILNISIVIACTIYANGPKPKSADTRKKKTT